MNEPSPMNLTSPDAGSRSAGEVMRRARETQGMTLEALASMIKVTPSKLEALEAGRHDELPDANFTRALAMTVCRALKIDASQVLAGLPAARPAALAEGKPPLNQPFKESKGGASLFDRHGVDLPALVRPKYLAPALLLLGAVLIYALPDHIFKPAWLTGAGPVETAVTPPPPVSLPSAEADRAVPSGAPASSSELVPSAVAPAAVPLQLDPASAVATPAESSSVSATPAAAGVQITVHQPSWLEVRDARGIKLFSRIANAGETLALEGPTPLSVRIGNVGGVQVRFNGQPVDLSGFARNNVARLDLK